MTVPSGFAVIGYAARFPGAGNIDEFWNVLTEARDAVSEVPADRWDADEFYDTDPDAVGKMVARRAGFIDDVTAFDAPFFGVSAREAMFMDPQHRLMLETAWWALEHAGIAPAGLAGTRTGVFMGLSTHEFLGMLIRYGGYQDVDIYSGTGTSPAAGAGRISYRLGLQGPSVVIDTACSSSLVAVHQACRAIEAGDCDMALVGGVNVILTPIPMINLTKARMLAPDGRCKTFDATADGYVRGEGCGVLVLKRTDDAARDGDRVRAVIRSSAVNQDGASGGLTVPNGIAQQRVIAEALRRAGVSAADIDYLEAHGTGTSLGDPIEVQAAAAVLGEERDPLRPLLIGSAKTNIGHLEAASGIAGLIKVILSLEHQMLPRHLHFREPSPYIPWDRLPVRVVEQTTPWPRGSRPRRAGVSSFGFSGTNAHVIVEESPLADPAPSVESRKHRYQLLPLSARTPEALMQLASRYGDWLAGNPDAELTDICRTAGAGRSHFELRAALVADSQTRARRLLRALHEDRPAPGLHRGVCGDRPKTAWLFPGQGCQYPGMAQALVDSEPLFAQTVARCAAVVDELLPRPLLEVLCDPQIDPETLRDTSLAQPALFTVEVGLARLMQSWGLRPDVVLGHSVGQYSAAYVAGIISLEDGARLVAERGRLFGLLPRTGGMLAVFADAELVEGCAAEFPRLSVAAYNGANTVLSGPGDDLAQIQASLSTAGIRCERLATSHAFHSASLDPALDEFESCAAGFDFAPPEVALICNRTGEVLPRSAALDARYWRSHARQPVRFADSVGTLAQLGCSVLMELGPQPILTAAAMRIWPDGVSTPQTIAAMRIDADAHRCVTEALASAYTMGHQLDFASRCSDRRPPLDLPTYPFQKHHYWFTTAGAPAPSSTLDADAPQPSSTEPRTGDRLAGVPPEQRQEHVVALIQTELGNALRMPAADIPPSAEFMALGMDSLIAMELRRRLQLNLGAAVPASLFFSHPTVSSLAEGLLTLWSTADADPRTMQQPISAAPRPVALPGPLPLSHAQEQLWFLHELLPSSSAYNVAVRVDVPGRLDHDLLRRSLEAVVARHEVLRTAFRSENGVPQAILLSPLPFEMPVLRFDNDDEARAAAQREASTPFDITTGPLIRARLLEVGDQRSALVVTMHHIVTDGWSFRVLLRDLGLIYQALERGDPTTLPDLHIQYADYAQWQRDRLHGKDLDANIEYWRNHLAGASPLELDTDRPRPKTPTFRGNRIRFDLGQERARALRDLCRSENVTLAVPLLAAFAILLQRYSGQDDLVIGTLTANRDRMETEDLIGLFVNALPVRIHLGGEPDVAELVDRVRQRTVDALAHQDVPFDLIVNATAPDRDANRNPLFNTQLVVQPDTGAAELSGLGIDVTEIDTQTAKRDLTLTFFDDDLLSGHIEYATELFDAVRVEQLIAHLEKIVDAMVADRRQRISAISILTEPEQAHYRVETSAPTTDARSITELFESTVDRVPEAIAVTAVDGSLTYRQLDDAANRLARRLQHLGVRTGAAVGLCVGRTSSMAIGMLGILKAGGVYVPVDPSYPQDRIEHMLADAGVGLSLDEDGIDGADVGRYPADRLDIRTATNDLAYIMFTSGSTGRPKGVAISHGSVVEYAETLGREVGIRPDDVYLETASVSFSSSIRQLLLPFAVGAQVVIATTGERRDPAALLRRIRGSRVTVADLVPTVVRGVVETMAATVPEDRADLIPDSLRLLLTASEPLRAAVVRGWRDLMGPAATWINMYGQTETTGIVSLHRVGDPDGHDQSIVPIGRPRGNTGMYVLDRRLRPLPPGIDGELYIAGPALARGYLGPPEITAAKFVTAPWDYFERLYASGDMVRLRWDGTIEFRNRTDRQVKIRGLRVEPAEIDSVLLAHPGVREAVSAAQQTADASSVLVAYYVPEHAPVPLAELRAHVRRHLPEHMVPSTFVDLERLPQTPNGKLDRTALPVVVVSRDRDVEFVAPRDGVEESLAEIWRTTLHVDQIGAADNFFELGGHSLLAAQVRAQIHRVLGIELPLEALFEDQTLSDLARRIETDTGAHADEAPALVPAGRTTTLPISYAQELMWHAERDRPGSAAHWIDVSVRIGGRLDTGALVDGLQEAARRHELLRTTFRPSAGSVSQVILDPHSLDVPVLEHLPDAGGTNLCHDMADEWHDLDTRPPIRPELVRLSDDEHVLRLRVHRILADGYTMRLLLSEIGGLVATRLGFNDFPLLDGDLQYADYAVWERSWLTSTALTRRIDHFCAQFARSQPRDVLPTDHPRSHASLGVGRQFGFEFPDAAAHAVRALAVREQTSLYTVLLAGFAAALGRYAGQRTVVIGSPMTRRNHPATQLILGPFMNTVPLCIDLADAEDLSALVRATRAAMVGALANQDAPWQHVRAALVEQLGPIASGIGEIAFLMDEPTPDQFAVGGFTLTRIPAERVVARRALTVAMSTRNDQLTGTVTYDRALFDTTTIQHIVADFVSALSLSPADHT